MLKRKETRAVVNNQIFHILRKLKLNIFCFSQKCTEKKNYLNFLLAPFAVCIIVLYSVHCQETKVTKYNIY